MRELLPLVDQLFDRSMKRLLPQKMTGVRFTYIHVHLTMRLGVPRTYLLRKIPEVSRRALLHPVPLRHFLGYV